MKSKTFFIVFKGLLMKQITKNFLEGKSPTLSEVSLALDLLKEQNIQFK